MDIRQIVLRPHTFVRICFCPVTRFNMVSFNVALSACSLLLGSSLAQLLPNVNATFGDSPAPFKIDVDLAFIEAIRVQVRFARAPIPIDGIQPQGSDGPPLNNFTTVQNYWLNSYSWQATQARINRQSVPRSS